MDPNDIATVKKLMAAKALLDSRTTDQERAVWGKGEVKSPLPPDGAFLRPRNRHERRALAARARRKNKP